MTIRLRPIMIFFVSLVAIGAIRLWLHSSAESVDHLSRSEVQPAPRLDQTVSRQRVKSEDVQPPSSVYSESSSPSVSEVRGSSDSPRGKTFALHAKGEKTRISNFFQTYELDDESAQALLKTLKSSDGQSPDFGGAASVRMIEPSDPSEPRVPFSQLTSDCPGLSQLPVPISIQISGTGDVMEIIPTLHDFEVPAALYSCQFSGGPPRDFSTVYVPPSILQGKS
jgi:hypothetical protein